MIKNLFRKELRILKQSYLWEEVKDNLLILLYLYQVVNKKDYVLQEPLQLNHQ